MVQQLWFVSPAPLLLAAKAGPAKRAVLHHPQLQPGERRHLNQPRGLGDHEAQRNQAQRGLRDLRRGESTSKAG